MTSEQDVEYKEAIHEYASFLYDLYLDSVNADTIEGGQNNANQSSSS